MVARKGDCGGTPRVGKVGDIKPGKRNIRFLDRILGKRAGKGRRKRGNF